MVDVDTVAQSASTVGRTNRYLRIAKFYFFRKLTCQRTPGKGDHPEPKNAYILPRTIRMKFCWGRGGVERSMHISVRSVS